MRQAVWGLVVLGTFAGCAAPVRQPVAPTEAPGDATPEAAATRPTPPDPSSRAGIVCAGQQEMRLEGKVIDAPGAAITASGQCRLTIVHSTLRGGEVGVRASGSARVVVEDSTVNGGRRAISVSDNATIETRHTSWNGGIEAADHSRVIDQGDNTWSR
jgi:hypothetical protein